MIDAINGKTFEHTHGNIVNRLNAIRR